ncbi:MAG: hypothetical protein WBG42_15760 [Cryomorphaceae bacterium]
MGFFVPKSPQACLKGLLGTKKHADDSRWFSFSEFGTNGIIRLEGG